MKRKLACDGKVKVLRDQLTLFTGRTYIRGKHVTKANLQQTVLDRGGIVAPDQNRKLTLLVLGDLDGQRIVDPINHRSQKVVFVDEQRRLGNHICMVDGVVSPRCSTAVSLGALSPGGSYPGGIT